MLVFHLKKLFCSLHMLKLHNPCKDPSINLVLCVSVCMCIKNRYVDTYEAQKFHVETPRRSLAEHIPPLKWQRR